MKSDTTNITRQHFYNMFSTLLIYALCFLLGACEERPTLETPSGTVRGYHKLSFGRRKFSAFEGLPYAKPPIGTRRFEEPEPLQPWIGTWDASFLHSCAQVVPKNESNVSEGIEISGDEDCLYLNIYVPREYPSCEENLDVVVHIHGGGFIFGNGHFYALPGYLMDRDVVFVTFNYRLGILGFLSTEDGVVSGNNGLKDQVLALKWIQKNIASFGGNPNSVTLTGASAGGASVHLHYLSPMSRGLFHRGLSTSGSALPAWAIQKGALDKAKSLGIAVGCPDGSTEILIECLKQKSYRQILSKIEIFFDYKFEPVVAFAPVVEKGPKPFIDQSPEHLLESGQVQDLPWITSNVAHEGNFFVSGIFENNIEEINKDWKKSAPFTLYYNYTVPRASWEKVAKNIKKFYLGEDQTVNSANFNNFAKIFGDRMVVNGGVEASKLQAKVTKSPVFYYYFSYTGDYNSTIVQHSDDNQYFFSENVSGRPPTPNELKMKDIMVDMLISYAKTGKPIIDGVNWEPTKHDHLTFLNISGFNTEEMELKTDDGIAHEDFWKSLESE